MNFAMQMTETTRAENIETLPSKQVVGCSSQPAPTTTPCIINATSSSAGRSGGHEPLQNGFNRDDSDWQLTEMWSTPPPRRGSGGPYA